MTLTELRCPGCGAPIDAAKFGLAKCRYCGASLLSKSALEAAPMPPSAENAENPGFLDVRLDGCGSDKIRVVRAVREHLHLGLAGALELVDKAPCVLVQAMEGESAKSFLDALAKAGAKARGT